MVNGEGTNRDPLRLSARVARALVALCATFFVLAVVAGAYLLANLARIRSLQSELLATTELQERLLSRNPLDNCLYPHRNPSIGYVLNPHMKKGTLWADPDTPYPINSIGLRGREITNKKAGTTRIILLGDSWFFGVGLQASERLDARMEAILDTRIDGGRYEVVTVAVPGWNVTSEAAFLEAHLGLLDPDLIVWEICSNDVQDLGGVVPPGTLALYLSAQTPGKPAFTRITQSQLPMPFILGRYRSCVATMERVHSRLGVPILVTPVDIPPPLMAIVLQDHALEIPQVFIPPQYRTRLDYRVSVSDSHPSALMNEIMAVAYLRDLSDLGLLPSFDLVEGEATLVAEWEEYNGLRMTPELILDYAAAQESSVSREYSATTGFQEVCAGVVDGDMMAGRGVAYLRVAPKADTIRLEFEPASEPQRLTVAVRDAQGRAVTVTEEVGSDLTRIDIPLAHRAPGSEVYEIQWDFSSEVCTGPSLCYAGRLVRLQSL